MIFGAEAGTDLSSAYNFRAMYPQFAGSLPDASRVAIPRAVELMAGRIDDMVLVTDEELRAAQAELTMELGITVEGAGGASWAGLLAGPRPEGPALVIVTGSNV